MYKKVCYNTCPGKTFHKLANNECIDCLPQCLSCENETECKSCDTGKYLH